ncbi:MAG: DNA-3-methyladenine glycosylase family protein [bacterium]
MMLFITTPTHFSFLECLGFLNRSNDERLHHIKNGGVRKLIKWHDRPVLFELHFQDNRGLQVNILNTVATKELRDVLQKYVHEWFDLNRNLTPFYRMAQKDRLLAGVVQRHAGLRLVRIHDLFQALCWAIIGQQINLTFAYTLYKRFIESFGESLDYDGNLYWLFPATGTIASLSITDLRKLQFTGKKSEYVIGLARHLENGELSKQRLLESEDINAAGNELLAVRGVGPWTANYVLMRCLGYPSAFPIEDVGLHRAMQNQLQWDRKPTLAEIRELSAGWYGWHAYATFYLYRSLYD